MKTIIALIFAVFTLNAQALVYVEMQTSLGTIEIELNDAQAPITVENFLHYVDTGFFNGTIFHRTIKNFVVQGGGHLPDMTELPTAAPIRNEATNGLSNLRGSLGMARTSDIDSATSQFFINTVDNVRLDHQAGNPARYGYAVFGRVTQGMDVVDVMQNVPTHTVGEYQNVPVEPILILSVTRKNLP
jgi:cyclophilin family peptidyl-prolyl cis-trans isomerase